MKLRNFLIKFIMMLLPIFAISQTYTHRTKVKLIKFSSSSVNDSIVTINSRNELGFIKKSDLLSDSSSGSSSTVTIFGNEFQLIKAPGNILETVEIGDSVRGYRDSDTFWDKSINTNDSNIDQDSSWKVIQTTSVRPFSILGINADNDGFITINDFGTLFGYIDNSFNIYSDRNRTTIIGTYDLNNGQLNASNGFVGFPYDNGDGTIEAGFGS